MQGERSSELRPLEHISLRGSSIGLGQVQLWSWGKAQCFPSPVGSTSTAPKGRLFDLPSPVPVGPPWERLAAPNLNLHYTLPEGARVGGNSRDSVVWLWRRENFLPIEWLPTLPPSRGPTTTILLISVTPHYCVLPLVGLWITSNLGPLCSLSKGSGGSPGDLRGGGGKGTE